MRKQFRGINIKVRYLRTLFGYKADIHKNISLSWEVTGQKGWTKERYISGSLFEIALDKIFFADSIVHTVYGSFVW